MLTSKIAMFLVLLTGDGSTVKMQFMGSLKKSTFLMRFLRFEVSSGWPHKSRISAGVWHPGMGEKGTKKRMVWGIPEASDSFWIA